jgi:hypothetical protein
MIQILTANYVGASQLDEARAAAALKEAAALALAVR